MLRVELQYINFITWSESYFQLLFITYGLYIERQ
jgi:hypothetical protein